MATPGRPWQPKGTCGTRGTPIGTPHTTTSARLRPRPLALCPPRHQAPPHARPSGRAQPGQHPPPGLNTSCEICSLKPGQRGSPKWREAGPHTAPSAPRLQPLPPRCSLLHLPTRAWALGHPRRRQGRDTRSAPCCQAEPPPPCWPQQWGHHLSTTSVRGGVPAPPHDQPHLRAPATEGTEPPAGPNLVLGGQGRAGQGLVGRAGPRHGLAGEVLSCRRPHPARPKPIRHARPRDREHHRATSRPHMCPWRVGERRHPWQPCMAGLTRW